MATVLLPAETRMAVGLRRRQCASRAADLACRQAAPRPIIVMLVMSEKGMKGMLATKFTLGGEASAAPGPVGRDATAQTDASMRADILSWSRSRGVFGGLSLQGGTLRPDDDFWQPHASSYPVRTAAKHATVQF